MRKIILYCKFGLLIFLPLCFSNCSSKHERMNLEKAVVNESVSDSVALSEDQAQDKADFKQPTLAKEINVSTKIPSDKKLIRNAELKFKVANVLTATEKIEDLTAKYDGYIVYSNLQNRQDEYDRIQYRRDSILICQQITVVNNIQLRIPNVKLDSFIRNLNAFVLFLDSRVIKLNDVTYQYMRNMKKTERLKNYSIRQLKHIDNKNSKLHETTPAEENLLNSQIQTDETQINNMELDDQLKYCNISIEIYQKPIVVKEVVFNFGYVASSKPGFFKRMLDSIIYGWWILEEIIIFLLKFWWIAVLVLSGLVIFKYFNRKTKT
jgi:hypothetical protein